MKKYIVLIYLILCCFTSELLAPDKIKITVKQYLKELNKLSNEQKEVMLTAYARGKASGYDLLLPAIAWKESYFGKYNINVGDGKYGSYGPYHVRLDIYASKNNIKGTFIASVIATKFLNDLDFSTNVAIEYINYFAKIKKLSNTPIFDIAARYNGGNVGHTKRKPKLYALDVLLRMKALDIYLNKRYENISLDNEIVISFSKTHS